VRRGAPAQSAQAGTLKLYEHRESVRRVCLPKILEIKDQRDSDTSTTPMEGRPYA
jgi:hypothetical protein